MKKSKATPEWLQPISQAQPCGPNLEYDGEYAVLLARFTPQSDAQYGNFVDKPEPPDWASAERDCRRLLLRSKDIAIFIWLARCRTRLAGAVGLRDVLSMLAQTLQRYPEEVHPQRIIEGEDDPAVRANALAALTDPQGLLSDLREITLSANTAFRLTVKDVERAHAIPRLADALSIESVTRQLDDLRAQGHAQILALAESAALVESIEQWGQHALQDDAPVLTAIRKLLAPFCAEAPGRTPDKSPPADVPTAAPSPVDAQPEAAPVDTAPPAVSIANTTLSMNPATSISEQREQVRAHIRFAKEWLDHNEPSSPVAILLKQAEKLLGKRFSEVAQAIPPDLLAKWEEES